MNKTEPNTIEQGWINLSIMALYTAIKDDEVVEDDDILSETRSMIEESTGITLNLMKSIIAESRTSINFVKLTSEAPNKTISQLSHDFNVSKDTIRSYFNRNNIQYKHSRTDTVKQSVPLCVAENN